MRTLARRHPLATFFTLTISISFSAQIISLMLAEPAGLRFGNEENLLHLGALLRGELSMAQALPLLLFSLAMGPLIAALITTGLAYGRSGLDDLLRRSTKWRVPARWYVTVLALPLITAGVSLLAGIAAEGFTVQEFTPKLPWVAFVPLLIYMIIFTGIAEEIGWRGFALPHLQRRHSAEKASWLLALVWGVWHFPFLIYFNLKDGMLLGAIIPVLIISLPLLAGWTIVNTWVYNNTESVLLIVLLHGWNNTIQSYFVLAYPGVLTKTLFSIVPWAIAIMLLKYYGKEHLAPHTRPMAPPVDQAASKHVTVSA